MQSYYVLPSSASRHCLHAFCVTVDSLSDLPFVFFGFILIRLRLERHGALMCLVICTDIHINIHASQRLDRDTVEVKKDRCPIKQDASVRAPSFCPIISLFFSVFSFIPSSSSFYSSHSHPAMSLFKRKHSKADLHPPPAATLAPAVTPPQVLPCGLYY